MMGNGTFGKKGLWNLLNAWVALGLVVIAMACQDCSGDTVAGERDAEATDAPLFLAAGAIRISPRFSSEPSPFRDGMAFVHRKGGGRVYFNKDGRAVWPPQERKMENTDDKRGKASKHPAD